MTQKQDELLLPVPANEDEWKARLTAGGVYRAQAGRNRARLYR